MKLSKTEYGMELALAVYDYLAQHNSIRFNHYGYCGTGLIMNHQAILYTHIDEWETYQNAVQYQPSGDYIGIIKSFSCKDDFVNWLAEQSDDSLSGKETNDAWYINNQRITKSRLESLLSANTGSL